ncbi:RICIN domain-containing protein [Lentzea sp. NPDC051213]|uniref:RICIN domain-containing protein n=1 Tax=Lentzea sp. NPDC051213 TaxID=3364126 RepID=UPI0037BDB71D
MHNRLVRGLAVAAGLAITALAGISAPAVAAPAAGSVPNTVAAAALPGAFYAEAIIRNSGKCVNVAGGSSDNGAWIQQYRCDRTPAAKFLFLSNADGYYEISNQSSRKCIDIEHGGYWNGARTQQFNCNGSFTQQYRLVDLGNGYYNFVSRFSGRCVNVPWGNTDDRVVMNIWDCIPGKAEQQFRLNIG